MLAVMGLLPWTATVTADKLRFDGQDLLNLSPKQRRKLIGKDITMIFQEPMTSLNPCFTVSFQIKEVLRVHLDLTRQQRHARAVELLELVGIPDAEKTPVIISPSIIRWHEPAGNDRHCHCLQPQTGHCR